MTAIFNRSLFAVSLLIAGAALTGPAQAGNDAEYCRSLIRASVEGGGNITRADAADCAEIGIFVDGYDHRTDVKVDGPSRTSTSQTGDGTVVQSESIGAEHDTGIVAADGAEVYHRAEGFDNDAAIYAKGGVVDVESHGNGNKIVVKTK